jgi:cobalt-zinc-cadmium efflux system membrane fusion protein
MRILFNTLSLVTTLSLLACGSDPSPAPEPSSGESGPAALKRVRLDEAQQKRLQIQEAVAGPASIDRRISLPASIQASPHKTVHMTSRVPGVIRKLHVKLGEAVSQGTPLICIDSVDIGESARDYLRALELLDAAKQTLEEERKLLSRQLERETKVLERAVEVAQEIFAREEELKKQEVSTLRPWLEAQRKLEEARLARETRLTELELTRERRLLQLQVAMRQATIEEHAAHNKLHSLGLSEERILALRTMEPTELGRYDVISPMDGVVVRAHVALNEYVTAEQVLFEIQNLDAVWLGASVFEKDLTQVQVGNPLSVQLQAHGDRTFEGKVDYLDFIVDPETRTARIRAVLQNDRIEGWKEKYPLRPGMFGTASVSVGAREVPVVVPTSSIVHEGELTFVFVKEGPGVWVRTPVRVAQGTPSLAEITSGLSAGKTVATSQIFTLKSLARSSEIGEED